MEFKDFKYLGKVDLFLKVIPLNDITSKLNIAIEEVRFGLSVMDNADEIPINGFIFDYRFLLFPQEVDLNVFREILNFYFQEYKKLLPDIQPENFIRVIFPINRFSANMKYVFKKTIDFNGYEFFTIFNPNLLDSFIVFHETKPLEYFQVYFEKVEKIIEGFIYQNTPKEKNEVIPTIKKPWRNQITEDLFYFLKSLEPKFETNSTAISRVFVILNRQKPKTGEDLSFTNYIRWVRNDPNSLESQKTVEPIPIFKDLENKAEEFLGNYKNNKTP